MFENDSEVGMRVFCSVRSSIMNICLFGKQATARLVVKIFYTYIYIDEHPWKCKYVIYLDLYRDLYERWSSCTDPNQLSVRLNQMKRWVKYIFIMISCPAEFSELYRMF